MMTPNQFYRELAQTPDIPDYLYTKIDSRIRRRQTVVRVAWALSFAMVLAIGGISFSLRQSGVIEPDVADELQNVNDYLNGNDIDTNAGTNDAAGIMPVAYSDEE